MHHMQWVPQHPWAALLLLLLLRPLLHHPTPFTTGSCALHRRQQGALSTKQHSVQRTLLPGRQHGKLLMGPLQQQQLLLLFSHLQQQRSKRVMRRR